MTIVCPVSLYIFLITYSAANSNHLYSDTPKTLSTVGLHRNALKGCFFTVHHRDSPGELSKTTRAHPIHFLAFMAASTGIAIIHTPAQLSDFFFHRNYEIAFDGWANCRNIFYAFCSVAQGRGGFGGMFCFLLF
ncbi:hypothetical protein DFS34DRAFT_417964 [Phlyctochytrium arcticum]|nr:hypothetical protein DFS34DRAFT_417964 [Phlyctochytrium arcticum]